MEYDVEWVNELNTIVRTNISIIQSMKYRNNAIVIFDIDNTLLDSNGFRINQVITLFDFIKLMNIPIAIITTRIGTPENIKKTQTQLYNNCILDYKYIYFLKPLDYNIIEFKNNSNQDIINKGYTIIMTIGDLYMENVSINIKIPSLIIKN